MDGNGETPVSILFFMKDWNIRRPLCLDGGVRQRRNVAVVQLRYLARLLQWLLTPYFSLI